MMKIQKILYTLIALLFLSSAAMAQQDVGGVKVPETRTYENQKLNLNGAGVRDKWFMDLYVISLYLMEKDQDEERIMIEDEKLQALHLDIISNMITSEKMQKSIHEGFEKSTQGNTGPIEGEIGRFIACFKEEIQNGDSFDLVYTPFGVKVYKNNRLVDTIEGEEFKEKLFGIWLGEEPVDDRLKADLLGK
jgi:hypothetical protein